MRIRRPLKASEVRDYIIAAVSWVILISILWYLGTQRPPPRAIYGLESLGILAVIIFFLVASLGAWRLTAVSARRALADAPRMDVHMDVDVTGRAVEVDPDTIDAQVIFVTFDENLKRYRSSSDA